MREASALCYTPRRLKWLIKVAAYKLLSSLPGGRACYQFSQRRITKSLAPSRARLSQKIEVALLYYRWLSEHQQAGRLLEGVHLDFGAGWHPTIPLLLYSMGVAEQHLLDVVPVLDSQLLEQTLNIFLPIVGDAGFAQRALVRRLPPPFRNDSRDQYLKALGCSYHAPYFGVFPSLAGKIDVVTSTQVLLYVPSQAMGECFARIHQSLKPGGLFLATIHLRDILAGLSQPGLVKYRQLRYSTQTWERWFCSSLMSFNRLKAPDYRVFLERAGFEVLHFEVEPGTAEELKELDQVPIAECFKRYTREDLAAKHLFFVARRP